jgi:enoyl-CoA hydratase/carnithine racemase
MRSDVKHFNCEIAEGIATVSLDRPDRKNPLTFDSYAELRDWFRDLHYDDTVKAVVFAPNGGNFSSGGDVHDIIGPLTKMTMKELLTFTRMTGDLVKAMVNCGRPVIAAVDGVCACAILPRIIGQGRAAELLYLGRSMSAEEGAAWGYFNTVVPSDDLIETATTMARRIADGPNFANMMTKTMLAQEWSMSIEQAIEAEAQAQAICMQGQDFHRAYHAFLTKEKPVFEGD